MRKKIYFISAAVVVVAVAVAIILSVMMKGGNGESPLRTARVERRDVVVKVTESGEVAPLTVVNIKSELAGEVKRLFVEEGDSVKAGDRLALVQQESSQAQQIAQARASVERAKIDLEDAERDLNRQRDLYDKGFVAKKDVEDAEQAQRRSQIQYELSEKQLWVALGGADEPVEPGSLGARAFDTITVTAPIAGVVIGLNVEQGEMITSGTQAYGGGGTILMTIADLSKMIVKTNVNEVDVGRIRVGQSVQIGFDAIRGRVYRGVVRKIAPAGTLDGNIVVFPIEVEIVGSTSGELPRSTSAPSSRSTSASTARAAGDGPLSQLPQEEQDAVRDKIRSLRAQGASGEEIRNAVEEALAKHSATNAPEGRPEGRPGPSSTGEEERSAIALIRPGMTADLDIIIDKAENVLCVPREAVIQKDGGAAVTVLEGDKTVSRPVTTGLEDNVYVEIRDGVEEGDEVITTGAQTSIRQRTEGRPRGGPPM